MINIAEKVLADTGIVRWQQGQIDMEGRAILWQHQGRRYVTAGEWNEYTWETDPGERVNPFSGDTSHVKAGVLNLDEIDDLTKPPAEMILWDNVGGRFEEQGARRWQEPKEEIVDNSWKADIAPIVELMEQAVYVDTVSNSRSLLSLPGNRVDEKVHSRRVESSRGRSMVDAFQRDYPSAIREDDAQ